MLQDVPVCYNIFWLIAAIFQYVAEYSIMVKYISVGCSIFKYVAVYFGMLQYG